MALVKCRECSRDVSSWAPSCPQCRAVAPNERHKKSLLLGSFAAVAIYTCFFIVESPKFSLFLLKVGIENRIKFVFDSILDRKSIESSLLGHFSDEYVSDYNAPELDYNISSIVYERTIRNPILGLSPSLGRQFNIFETENRLRERLYLASEPNVDIVRDPRYWEEFPHTEKEKSEAIALAEKIEQMRKQPEYKPRIYPAPIYELIDLTRTNDRANAVVKRANSSPFTIGLMKKNFLFWQVVSISTR